MPETTPAYTDSEGKVLKEPSTGIPMYLWRCEKCRLMYKAPQKPTPRCVRCEVDLIEVGELACQFAPNIMRIDLKQGWIMVLSRGPLEGR